MNMKNETRKKAVIYCRVSTKEQVEEGNSLATQEKYCRDYALKHNFEVSAVFIEEGESAKTADRTELQKLLLFCSKKQNHITAIIIYKIDRLSRNTDDYSQIRLLLKRYGVEIKSTSELFEDNPAGRFMENIIANVAQFDNDVRTERSVGGMKTAVREGRYVWMAPVGYKNCIVNGRSTITPDERAPLVKLAFQLMADRKYSVEKILEILWSKGLRTNTGKPLTRSSFYKMITNRLYTGTITQFGEINKGTFEALVSSDLFDRVQWAMTGKKRPEIYKKENPDFPLKRFIKHPKQHSLTGAWSQGRRKKYAYYRFLGTNLCWSKDDLEQAFCHYLDSFACSSEMINSLERIFLKNLSSHSNQKAQEIATLEDTLATLRQKQGKLIQKNLQGIISDAILKSQLDQISDQIWQLEQTKSYQEETQLNIKAIFKQIRVFLLSPASYWKKVSPEMKLKLQWFQFPEGLTYDGKEFRTRKISFLFNLKQQFSNTLSSNVRHSRQKNKHAQTANNPPVLRITSSYIQKLTSELKDLEAITEIDRKTRP